MNPTDDIQNGKIDAVDTNLNSINNDVFDTKDNKIETKVNTKQNSGAIS